MHSAMFSARIAERGSGTKARGWLQMVTMAWSYHHSLPVWTFCARLLCIVPIIIDLPLAWFAPPLSCQRESVEPFLISAPMSQGNINGIRTVLDLMLRDVSLSLVIHVIIIIYYFITALAYYYKFLFHLLLFFFGCVVKKKEPFRLAILGGHARCDRSPVEESNPAVVVSRGLLRFIKYIVRSCASR